MPDMFHDRSMFLSSSVVLNMFRQYGISKNELRADYGVHTWACYQMTIPDKHLKRLHWESFVATSSKSALVKEVKRSNIIWNSSFNVLHRVIWNISASLGFLNMWSLFSLHGCFIQLLLQISPVFSLLQCLLQIGEIKSIISWLFDPSTISSTTDSRIAVTNGLRRIVSVHESSSRFWAKPEK
jgi:hypothetical protein